MNVRKTKVGGSVGCLREETKTGSIPGWCGKAKSVLALILVSSLLLPLLGCSIISDYYTSRGLRKLSASERATYHALTSNEDRFKFLRFKHVRSSYLASRARKDRLIEQRKDRERTLSGKEWTHYWTVLTTNEEREEYWRNKKVETEVSRVPAKLIHPGQFPYWTDTLTRVLRVVSVENVTPGLKAVRVENGCHSFAFTYPNGYAPKVGDKVEIELKFRFGGRIE